MKGAFILDGETMEQPLETETFTDTDTKPSFLANLFKEEGLIVVGLVVLIVLIVIFSSRASRQIEENGDKKIEQKPAIIREIIREVAKPPEPAQPTNEGGK